jgi:hypothetical protein
MRAGVRVVAILLAAGVFAISGCTAGSHGQQGSSNSGQARGPGRGGGSRRGDHQSCPNSTPTKRASVPSSLRSRGGGPWYGVGDLWIAMWWAGSEASREHLATRGPDGVLTIKYGSVTLYRSEPSRHRGKPKLRVRRLDQKGVGEGDVGPYARPSSERQPGFWPTTIAFPHAGCWLVNESTDDSTVRLVLKVP